MLDLQLVLRIDMVRAKSTQDNEKDVRLAARASSGFQMQFKAKAESVGLNISEALLKLAEKFVKGEISLDDEENGDRINKLEREIAEIKQQLESVKEFRQGELTASIQK
ncbi:MAG: hypothetical protein V7K67_08955 [Nostoc sp.]|uniref:hypothetical protein n=1 Tax=Nostoc sp. TaxID=1180 RepID=UPI002FFB1D76